MKFIPKTNERYYITEDKKIFNAKTGKEMSQFKHFRLDKMQVTLIFDEGRRTRDVDKLYDALYNTPNDLKEIPYAKNYLISKDGRIFSKTTTGKEISPFKDKDGYKRIALVENDGVRRHSRVCRAVAITYIPNPSGLPFVNHINEVKDDDRVENLEWVTVSENVIHSKTWEKRERDEFGRFI